MVRRDHFRGSARDQDMQWLLITNILLGSPIHDKDFQRGPKNK